MIYTSMDNIIFAYVIFMIDMFITSHFGFRCVALCVLRIFFQVEQQQTNKNQLVTMVYKPAHSCVKAPAESLSSSSEWAT